MPPSARAGSLGQLEMTVDYAVRNPRGTLLFTSPDLAIAKKWLSERASQWPGAQVDEVCQWRSERRVFKPVGYLRAVS